MNASTPRNFGFLSHPTIRRLRQAQLILAIIIYTSLLLMSFPQTGAGGIPDYVLHSTGNALLVMSIWLALMDRFTAIHSLLFALPISISSEFIQSLNPSRAFDINDIAANICGVTIGFLICLGLQSSVNKIYLH
ncbi:MAG: glycopeptide antibiotics resistance protein [Flavobacteriales bacterium]|jgi:glycopeptide antibiotics resistance protein